MKYTVMPGDTMYKIAQRHGITLDELLAANPGISDPDLIFPGQVIEVPVAKPGIPSPELPPEEELPLVPPGPAGPPHPPEVPGGYPEMPPEMPDFSGDWTMPGYPGGWTMPGYPGGWTMPGYPGGWMPGCSGDWTMPGYPIQAGETWGFKKGDTGDLIRHLQKCLKEIGYYRGPASGRFGSRTACAVKRLQRDWGLPVNGIVDYNLWARITGNY